jgi:hypothetical protein
MTPHRTARLLAIPALALGLVSVASAVGAAPASSHATVDGNPTCADLAPAGVTWTEAKLDFDPAAGQYTVGSFEVTITKSDATTIGWESNGIDIDAVIMKGGPMAEV